MAGNCSRGCPAAVPRKRSGNRRLETLVRNPVRCTDDRRYSNLRGYQTARTNTFWNIKKNWYDHEQFVCVVIFWGKKM